MTESNRLLELIEDGIIAHGGDLGGWTRNNDDQLQLFDGRVTLRATVDDLGPDGNEGMVHAHVFTTLHNYDDEVLDACVTGISDTRENALAESAMIWVTCVAGPIRSFIDDTPVCMTCQAGVQGGDVSKGFSEGDYGLPGLRAYVGPAISRMIDNDEFASAMNDTMPWFRYAAESAAPRRVHMAKTIVQSKGKDGWHRILEIDGHEVSHHDPNWPTDIVGPEFGYTCRFAVFEFPLNSNVITKRERIDHTIIEFARRLIDSNDIPAMMREMENDGHDPDLVHEVESISTIAFGRLFFEEHGVQYASTITRVRSNGQIETDVPLMSIPTYSRGRAIAGQMRETLSEEQWRALCFYNAESNAILQAIENAGDAPDLSQLTMYPSVVPDRNVTDATMKAGLEKLQQQVDSQRPPKKPWWRFW